MTKGRIRWMAGLILILLLSAAACQSNTAQDIDVRATIDPSPPCVGPAEVTLFIVGKNDNPVHGAQVQVEGNMNHAGMQPVFADAEEVSAGTYVAHMRFTMAGDWFLLVTVTRPDGKVLESKVPVPQVRPQCP